MDAPQRRRLLACLPGLLALGAGARTDEPLKAAALHIEPYGMLDAQGRQSGIFIDTYDLLAREIGRPIEVIVAPYARTSALLQAGQIDMMFGIPNKVLAETAVPLASLWTIDVVALGRAGLKLASQRDLHGLTVARIRGTDYGREYMEDLAINHYETANQILSVQMLMEKRVDALIGTRLAIFHAMRKLGYRREQLSAAILVQQREVQLHLARRLADGELAGQLRRACAVLRSRDQLAAVAAKYSEGLPKE